MSVVIALGILLLGGGLLWFLFGPMDDEGTERESPLWTERR